MRLLKEKIRSWGTAVVVGILLAASFLSPASAGDGPVRAVYAACAGGEAVAGLAGKRTRNVSEKIAKALCGTHRALATLESTFTAVECFRGELGEGASIWTFVLPKKAFTRISPILIECKKREPKDGLS